jgi:hypothetical protein
MHEKEKTIYQLIFFLCTAIALKQLELKDIITIQTLWLRYLLISYRITSWLYCIFIGFVFFRKNDWLIKKNLLVFVLSFFGPICLVLEIYELFLFWTTGIRI